MPPRGSTASLSQAWMHDGYGAITATMSIIASRRAAVAAFACYVFLLDRAWWASEGAAV
jgi:hypothetical protein